MGNSDDLEKVDSSTASSCGDGRKNPKLTWKAKLLLRIIGFCLGMIISFSVVFLLRSAFSSSNKPIQRHSILKKFVAPKGSTISKTCGGVINISGRQKGYIIDEGENFERCAWIIKSDMKKVMVQYVSESLGSLSGTVIAELDAGDESLNCSKLSSDGKLTARTPFVLYYTKYVFSLPVWNWKRNFILELTPVVDDGNTHESQPATYHINKMNKGSLPLAAAPTRQESMLDMMSVFQTQKPNGTGRDFICSPTGTHQCCDYIGVYTMDLFHDGGSCKRMSRLNEGNGKGSTDDTVVILHWSHKIVNESECRLTWSEGRPETSKYSSGSLSRPKF